MRILIIILIIILVLGAIGAAYYFLLYEKPCSSESNPGVGKRCKCDQTGDDTSKFYGDNWRARGTVCDGGYIPSAVALGGASPVRVLELMGDLSASAGMPQDKGSLTLLAQRAVLKAN